MWPVGHMLCRPGVDSRISATITSLSRISHDDRIILNKAYLLIQHDYTDISKEEISNIGLL